jgi:hypothetical protein
MNETWIRKQLKSTEADIKEDDKKRKLENGLVQYLVHYYESLSPFKMYSKSLYQKPLV